MTDVTATAFAARMATLLPQPPAQLAVAVSGGCDSMALALLAYDWAKARNITLTALTVDHHLRAESSAEAEQVRQWLCARGMAHHILEWQFDTQPNANRQAAAREARYSLMAEWCAAHGIHHLLLGHHLDDQAETFLLRLQRGSGVDGLAAMRPRSSRHGLTLLRPLLDAPKTALQNYLHTQNQTWVEDPSNEDRAYNRTAMRELLAQSGLDASTLAATAERMARAQDYLQQQSDAAYDACCQLREDGTIRIHLARWQPLHEEIRLRVLADAIADMNGSIYRPRFSELKSLHDALVSTPPETRTLAGIRFIPEDGQMLLLRETAAIAAPVALAADSHGLWDGRFTYHCAPDCPPAQLGALGTEGWAKLKAAAPESAAAIRLPKRVLHTLPALWHLESPLLVPHIHYVDAQAKAAWLRINSFTQRRQRSNQS